MTKPISNNFCVAVTGLHRGENPQSGSAVIRSIRRAYPQVKIVGLCYDPMESGIYSVEYDHVDMTYLLPLPIIGQKTLFERIKEIIAITKIDLLIPCLDSEIENFIGISDELLEFGVKINLPSIYSLSLRSKENLPILCEEIGISYPRTLVANNFYDASKFAEENGYPIYIKGHFYEAHLSYNAQQIEDIFIKLKYDWGLPIIAQQCLFGEEYNVTGIGDGSGNISVFCEIRKLLRTKNGKGFAGVVIDDPALFLNSLKIIKRLNWNGPFELEFIKSNNGIYYLIEMNPRFPAWVDFPSQLGCNMPAALMNAPTSSGLEKNQICAPGKMFIRHCIDLAGDMSDFADLSIDGMKKLKTYSRI